ncbi:MAG: SusC/RagA family TonB-linked outer membrane protein [Mangrovibacterium sp.]
MKLTIGIIAFFVFQATAAISQNTVATIHANNLELDRFFSEIEKQTSVKFLYRYENIAGKQVSMNVENATVDNILEVALRDQGLSYSRMGNNLIVISLVESMQSKKISGTVTDESGLPLPGVSIAIKGTTLGTVSDMDGNFNLTVSGDQKVLVFSFIGYATQEVVIGTQTILNVIMIEEKHAIDEVVVTALGIERNKKSLTYATQQVNMEALSTIKDVSLGNSLAGKIAGVSVTASTGSTGVSGDPRIIIRGDRSITNNNQPLIVVDGIPYSNDGGGLSSINPDDVQSMNVLKGPAASALYGSSANNGVIVVTTKKGKSGEPKIEVNSVTNFDIPYLYPEFQNEYGQGSGGNFYPNQETMSWGPKMTGQTVTDWTGKTTTLDPQPDNVKDLFVTGYNFTNSFSYSVGTDRSTTYFSYSNTATRGVLKDNKMVRHNFNLRLTTELVKNLKMDFKLTYFRQKLQDKPTVGDDLFSPMWQLVKMPRSIRTADIRNSSYLDENLSLKQNTWAPGSTAVINPYWSMDGYENPVTSNIVNALVSMRYDFTSWLYLQVRGGMIVSNADAEEKTYWDTQYIYSGKGNYVTRFSKGQSLNGDVLLTFNKDITKDFRLGLNLGAEIKDSQNRAMESKAGGLTTENKFALNYAQILTSSDSESRIQKQSVYGMGQLSFRDYLFLDFTARNDWSSTLPAPFDYFYPSVGMTAIISDMVTLPDLISFLKLRGTYAEVGNDATFAKTLQTYGSEANGPLGMIYPNSTKQALNLIPEKTKSWEAGAEMNFFDNRLGIDFTWYKANTYNQLVRITSAPSSGFSQAWINCGNIQNRGIEVLLFATPWKNSDFEWNFSINFARNKNKVIELTDTMDEYEIDSPNLSIGETWIKKGRPYGEIYTKGFERNEDGKILIGDSGMPKVTPNAELYLGNFNYDWRSGITNNLRYKNWNLSFLIDLNYGGVRQSATEAMLLYNGNSKESLKGREDGLIIDGVRSDGTPNDIKILAQEYAQLVGGRISSGAGEPFNHEATNSRLRELSLGYTIPVRSPLIKSMRVSAVGRNLFYIYNGCKWFDPDVTYDVTRNGQGAESSFLPGTRMLGFNIKFVL